MDRTRRNGGRRECHGQWCASRRAASGSGGAAIAGAPPDHGRRRADPSSASFATSPAVRCRRHRVGRRPAHRHQRDRRAGPLRVQRAAGRRLSRSRSSHRLRLDQQPARAGRTWRQHHLVVRAQAAVDARGRPASGAQARPTILAAGFVGNTAIEPARAVAGRRRGSHDHSEVAWRLKHLKRSVLKEATDQADLRRGRRSGGVRPRRRRPVHAADRPGASGGQPAEQLPAGRPGQPADDRRLRQPAAAGVGRIAGARRRDGVAGRVGRLARRLGGARRDDAGRRRLVDGVRVVPDAGAGPARATTSACPTRCSATTDRTRRRWRRCPTAIAMRAWCTRFDSWSVNDRVSLAYGARYAKYGYLEKSLLSPRARLTVAPVDTLRVSVGASRRALAPGAEEFVPVDGRGHVAAAGADVCAHQGHDVRARAHATSGRRGRARPDGVDDGRRPRVHAAHEGPDRHAVRHGRARARRRRTWATTGWAPPATSRLAATP